MSTTTLLNCYAKINLGLSVLGKRSDGYHELETLMHEIDLCDQLFVEESNDDQDHLAIEGLHLKVSSDNLLFKTLHLVREAGYSMPSMNLKLVKKIPVGGGLGGGSSNAVALLRYCAKYCGMDGKLQDKIAAQLGSDTNFFLKGTTALCSGRGEHIALWPHPQLFFNLILPNFSCATPKVFGAFSMDQLGKKSSNRRLWRQSKGFGVNDLERACCIAYPEMQALLTHLRSSGEVFLSGSGSTLFTVHHDPIARNIRAQELHLQLHDVKLLPAQSGSANILF